MKDDHIRYLQRILRENALITEQREFLPRVEAMTTTNEFAQLCNDMAWDVVACCDALAECYGLSYDPDGDDQSSMYGGATEDRIFRECGITNVSTKGWST